MNKDNTLILEALKKSKYEPIEIIVIVDGIEIHANYTPGKTPTTLYNIVNDLLHNVKISVKTKCSDVKVWASWRYNADSQTEIMVDGRTMIRSFPLDTADFDRAWNEIIKYPTVAERQHARNILTTLNDE